MLAERISLVRLGLGLAVLGTFFLQSLAFSAEKAGYWTCGAAGEGGCCSASGVGDEQDSSLPSAPACEHAHCHPPLVIQAQTSVGACVRFVEQSFSTADECCPDGPVKAVDYPPQLS